MIKCDYSKMQNPELAEQFMVTVIELGRAVGVDPRDFHRLMRDATVFMYPVTRAFADEIGEPMGDIITPVDNPVAATQLVYVTLQNAQALGMSDADLMATICGWAEAMTMHVGAAETLRADGMPTTPAPNLQLIPIELATTEGGA